MRARILTLLTCLFLAAAAFPHDGEVPEVTPGPNAFPKGSVGVPRRPGDPTGEFPGPQGPTTGPVREPGPAPGTPRPPRPDHPGIPKRGGKPRPASETNSPDHWSTWWMLNRERFVDLRSRRETRGRALRSGSTLYFFGKGSPRNVRPNPRAKALASVLAVLEKATSDRNKHVATSAIIALGKSGNARAVPLLIRLSSDQGRRREERESALLALGMLGLRVSEARDALIAALTNHKRNAGERTFAALGLALLADPASVPVLMRQALDWLGQMAGKAPRDLDPLGRAARRDAG